MENDSVRSSGDSTLVDVWIDGKMRSITVARGAIEAYLHLSPDRAARHTDDDRREFVRTHLALVLKAAMNHLRSTDPAADSVLIEGGQLGGHWRGDASPRTAEARSSDRRKGDRRKGDRRTANLGPPPSGERRR